MSRVIYFVERQSDGLVKIGVTKNLTQRISVLQRKHGHMEILGVVSGGRVREKILHLLFEAARVEGEFFKLTDDLIQFIEEHAQLPKPKEIPNCTIRFDVFTPHRKLELLKGRPIKLEEIAGSSGLHINTVYSLFKNRSKRVDLETLEKLVAYFNREGLDIDAGDLFTTEVEEPA